MSACIGASAAGARTYTATASQGLLFMAEALYNASGLGLPIVMTVANRAIGAPINIWNDHSDSMSQRDSRLDPALRRVQPGGRRPARPGVPARRGAVAAGDGLHGRLRPHPRRSRRSTCPSQEQVDAFLPPFEPRQVLDPDDPVTIGAMVGPEAFTEVKYLMHAKQMQALDAIPRIAGRVRAGASAATPAACSAVPAARTPRRSSSRSARCSARSRRSSTSCASEGVDDRRARRSRASGRGPLEEVRAALAGAQRVVVVEKAFAVGAGGIVGQNVRLALSRAAGRRSTTWSPGSAAGRSRSARCTALFADVARRAARAGAAALPRPRPRAGRARAARARASAAARARTPRTSCATSAPSPPGSH